MTTQKGFTLIELMIVIAIIGILGILAMPLYQDFTARAQATEGFRATSGLQTDVVMFATEQGRLPTTADLAADGAAVSLASVASQLQGKYFNAKSVTLADKGVITVAFNNGANAGKAMTLTPAINTATGQITGWACAPATNNGIDTKRLPSSCL